MDYPKTPSFNLNGKRSLVTGAGRGIGMGASIALAQAGSEIVMVSRTEEQLIALNDHIKKLGLKSSYKPLDVTNDKDLKEFIKNEKVNVLKAKPKNKDHTIELLEASDKTSIVRKFINKRGEGLHHIALEVDNISEAIKYLLENNIEIIYKTPKVGAGNKLITFIDPKSTPGILLELCQTV